LCTAPSGLRLPLQHPEKKVTKSTRVEASASCDAVGIERGLRNKKQDVGDERSVHRVRSKRPAILGRAGSSMLATHVAVYT
jgi:hypothetical protein